MYNTHDKLQNGVMCCCVHADCAAATFIIIIQNNKYDLLYVLFNYVIFMV